MPPQADAPSFIVQHPASSAPSSGHSLGGATAALVTLLLRASPDVAADHPSIRAVCFGPLPCLDVGLGKACSGFVTSVVNGESVR